MYVQFEYTDKHTQVIKSYVNNVITQICFFLFDFDWSILNEHRYNMTEFALVS